jgi:hypothetical protein
MTRVSRLGGMPDELEAIFAEVRGLAGLPSTDRAFSGFSQLSFR